VENKVVTVGGDAKYVTVNHPEDGECLLTLRKYVKNPKNRQRVLYLASKVRGTIEEVPNQEIYEDAKANALADFNAGRYGYG
jgi:hypothetical protein